MKPVVYAFYKFVVLEDYSRLKPLFIKKMITNQIKGTILLAKEGINGTLAGPTRGMNKFFTWLRKDKRFNKLTIKKSYPKEPPFHRTKVKLKKEIVTMGVHGIDPGKIVGTYVKPKDWNKLIKRKDVTVVDTRNNYEVNVGTFKGAINPHTTTFRQFPSYVKKKLKNKKNKKIAMFCTGGIRCEKSTAYLKENGFNQVFHLKGGILKYLEEIPKKKTLWQGDCFVFDDRVTVDHSLKPGDYKQCFACRWPVSKVQQKSKRYIKGISCPRCYKKLSKDQKKRFAERQKQVELASKRGMDHIGASLKPMHKRGA